MTGWRSYRASAVFINESYKYSAATRLNHAHRRCGRLYFPLSTIFFISTLAWFIASSAVSSPLFALER